MQITILVPFPLLGKFVCPLDIVKKKFLNKVDLASANDWADYVFEKKHKLISLKELEKFIMDNKHLPGIPTASEAVQNGVDLLEMDSKLLAKIEELTLYIIEQEKRIKALEAKNK